MQYASTNALGYDNMNNAETLYIRSTTGRYKIATDDQILAAGRAAAESLIAPDDPMSNPRTTSAFFKAKLAGLGHECAAFLYLDSQHKPITYIEHGHGTVTQASVYPREIVKTSLRVNAVALVMAHNHPSGIAEPSPADLALTRHLKTALQLVDVKLLDHIIVTGTSTTSLAERGQL